MHIVAETVKCVDIKIGDLFSRLPPEYWQRFAMLSSLGEKVYIRTNGPVPDDELNDTTTRIRIIRDEDENGDGQPEASSATRRTPELQLLVDRLANRMAGRTATEAIAANAWCACGRPAATFRDAISGKEYLISGLCQKCQDKVFGVRDDS